MAFYWQHVGIANAERDFPRTLGTVATGLRHFSGGEVLRHFNMEEADRASLQTWLLGNYPSGFQIWGVPEGAFNAVRDLGHGDYFMAMDTYRGGSGFQYIGRVIHRFQSFQPAASEHLWTEDRFPIVFFLQGSLINYPWRRFQQDTNLNPSWFPTGTTHQVAEPNLAPHVGTTLQEFSEYIRREYAIP